MAEVIRMPRMSDTMEEGVIVEWLKKVGDKVEVGDVLAEVETDKATMELESFQEGYLLHIGVEQGAVPVDAVLAVIGEQGEDFQSALDSVAPEPVTKEKSAEEKAPETPSPVVNNPVAATEAPQPEPVTAVAVGESAPAGRLKASPLARAMASEAGIDLKVLQGTGDNGRIVKRDIEAAIKSGVRSTPPAAPTVAAPAREVQYGEVPVSQMRKTIARRLAESKFTAPHFYLTLEIDMSKAWKDRKEINENPDVRISFNDFVVKACAMALRSHPAVNSSWLGDTIRVNQEINVGVAVAVPDGLLVPVIRNADLKGMAQINTEVKELAGRAREKKLGLEEMQGNTFTISNLGMFGIEEFTAIINPPDSCILAVGGIIEKPVVRNGEITTARMMKVTLSCDHRVVDGATGAQFLQTVKEYLENPVRMLV